MPRRRRVEATPERPVDPALLAQFDGQHEFEVTIREGSKTVTKMVSDTLEGVMKRAEGYLEASLHREYDRRKQDWLRQHPTATDGAYEQACRRIAKELGL